MRFRYEIHDSMRAFRKRITNGFLVQQKSPQTSQYR